MPSASGIYTKTAAGFEEITRRERRLPALQRRLLILVDGERERKQLARLLDVADIDPLLAGLASAGLIAPRGAAAPVRVAAQALCPATLHRARTLMRESAVRHLGVFGNALQHAIDDAADRSALLSVSARWHMEMRGSRKGRKEADALLLTLREILGAA
ncbi:hypothetical protein [Thauera linaloolentis]|uniref:Uncharacterized protein n=1 Tax=Thauera linaloolentis (strain DSM 12138 / JCM 21573 / CCUG 41526 / CIP 105981 / IAM 15112 / NBRC 102519 / 47Lol) TaxID=1123367 RepID=N6Y428_THAL4|nr:hypothetical protein [Thauera linaloolentis]ENO86350.1 hypothetical protein C666_13410 [Thauera linaloolentis 47Lol = DSM 12138]MCM8565052.1 hypothetical protein [Thauera linaloolentis]